MTAICGVPILTVIYGVMYVFYILMVIQCCPHNDGHVQGVPEKT